MSDFFGGGFDNNAQSAADFARESMSWAEQNLQQADRDIHEFQREQDAIFQREQERLAQEFLQRPENRGTSPGRPGKVPIRNNASARSAQSWMGKESAAKSFEWYDFSFQDEKRKKALRLARRKIRIRKFIFWMIGFALLYLWRNL